MSESPPAPATEDLPPEKGSANEAQSQHSDRELADSKSRSSKLDSESVNAEDSVSSEITQDSNLRIATFRRSKHSDEFLRLIDLKSAEAEQLVGRLLRQRETDIAIQREVVEMRAMKARNAKLRSDNKRLRAEVGFMRSRIAEFVIEHREVKAERRTEQLRRIAELRREHEERSVGLYGFILRELSVCFKGKYDVDEESARKVVQKAASLLKARVSRDSHVG
jgi:hypothetical protein